MEGDRRAGDQEKRWQEVYRRWENRVGKLDSQGGMKWEKKEKLCNIVQIVRNRRNAKRQEPTNAGRELGFKGMESGMFNPSCSHKTHISNRSTLLLDTILCQILRQVTHPDSSI